jgi:hypothetical protein
MALAQARNIDAILVTELSVGPQYHRSRRDAASGAGVGRLGSRRVRATVRSPHAARQDDRLGASALAEFGRQVGLSKNAVGAILRRRLELVDRSS